MTAVVVDVPKAIELMAACVEERGEDWVYPDQGQCRYIYDPENYPLDTYPGEDGLTQEEQKMVDYFGDEKQPACLVGLALHKLDDRFDSIMFDNNDNSVEGWMGGADIGYRLTSENGLDVQFTNEAIMILQIGQSAQDSGQPWGEALNRARTQAVARGLMP